MVEIGFADTGKAMMSNKEIFPGWPALEGMAIQNVVFQLRFTVPKTFGVPGAIIVHNGHPNEFLLISFNLELPDRSTAHYVTESWVYNTEKTDGRIFFRNKVCTSQSRVDFRSQESLDPIA